MKNLFVTYQKLLVLFFHEYVHDAVSKWLTSQSLSLGFIISHNAPNKIFAKILRAQRLSHAQNCLCHATYGYLAKTAAKSYENSTLRT